MIDMHTVNQKKQRKYIDSYNTEEKNYWCARCKQKKKPKKYIDSYVHAVNKKDKDSINQSPQLLISSNSYSLHGIYSPIHHITLKRFFFLSFYSLVFFWPKQFALCFLQYEMKEKNSTVLIFYSFSPINSINLLLHSTLIPLIILPTIFNSCMPYILQTTISNNICKYLSVLYLLEGELHILSSYFSFYNVHVDMF